MIAEGLFVDVYALPNGKHEYEIKNLNFVMDAPPVEITYLNKENKRLSMGGSFTATCSSLDPEVWNRIYGVKETSMLTFESVVGRVQKRRHKKRRINKKWAKRYGYKEIVFAGELNPNASIGLGSETPYSEFILENCRTYER